MSKILGLVAGCLFAINVLVVSVTRTIIIDNSRSIVSSQSKVQGIQLETVYAMLGIKMSAIENDVFSSWNKAYSKYYNKNLASEKIRNYIDSVNALLKFVSPTILLFVGIYLANENIISIGAIISIYSLGNTFFWIIFFCVKYVD